MLDKLWKTQFWFIFGPRCVGCTKKLTRVLGKLKCVAWGQDSERERESTSTTDCQNTLTLLPKSKPPPPTNVRNVGKDCVCVCARVLGCCKFSFLAKKGILSVTHWVFPSSMCLGALDFFYFEYWLCCWLVTRSFCPFLRNYAQILQISGEETCLPHPLFTFPSRNLLYIHFLTPASFTHIIQEDINSLTPFQTNISKN